MSEFPLSINDRSYPMRCEEDEKPHIEALGKELDARIRTLAGHHGQIGDQRLLIMTALSLIDELHDRQKALKQAKQSLLSRERGPDSQAPDSLQGSRHDDIRAVQADMAYSTHDAARRLEDLCQILEKHVDGRP